MNLVQFQLDQGNCLSFLICEMETIQSLPQWIIVSINRVNTCKHQKHSISVIYNQYPLQQLGVAEYSFVVFSLLRPIAHLMCILPIQHRDIHFKNRAKEMSIPLSVPQIIIWSRDVFMTVYFDQRLLNSPQMKISAMANAEKWKTDLFIPSQ